jgi:hypothetical protein
VTAWLGVVSAEHVRRGVSLGIAQIGHGKRGGLAWMTAGDWLVYYSPTERLGDARPLRAFTALGRIADDHIWQADEEGFRPFRRRVDYDSGLTPTPVAPLVAQLDLCRGPNWGYQLRRGLLPLTDHDLAVVRRAMGGSD